MTERDWCPLCFQEADVTFVSSEPRADDPRITKETRRCGNCGDAFWYTAFPLSMQEEIKSNPSVLFPARQITH